MAAATRSNKRPIPGLTWENGRSPAGASTPTGPLDPPSPIDTGRRALGEHSATRPRLQDLCPADPLGLVSGCDRYEWERVMRRCRLGSSTKYVGMVLAQYASRDGSRVYPGVARLVAVTELSERTVRSSLTKLRDLGLIERTRKGSSLGRQALTDEYRLAIPVDLIERVPMLDPDESPATAAGDRVERRAPDSPLRGSDHRQLVQGSPATGAGTPATDDRNTGNGCTPTNHDHTTYPPLDQRGADLGTYVTTAREDELPDNVIPLGRWGR